MNAMAINRSFSLWIQIRDFLSEKPEMEFFADGIFAVATAPTPPAFKTKSVKIERKTPTSRGFGGVMKEARQKGDLEFCFPVTNLKGETPQWEPLPLKSLKELQYSVKSIGPSAPYTLQIVEMLGSMWLTPYDCKVHS